MTRPVHQFYLCHEAKIRFSKTWENSGLHKQPRCSHCWGQQRCNQKIIRSTSCLKAYDLNFRYPKVNRFGSSQPSLHSGCEMRASYVKQRYGDFSRSDNTKVGVQKNLHKIAQLHFGYVCLLRKLQGEKEMESSIARCCHARHETH